MPSSAPSSPSLWRRRPALSALRWLVGAGLVLAGGLWACESPLLFGNECRRSVDCDGAELCISERCVPACLLDSECEAFDTESRCVFNRCLVINDPEEDASRPAEDAGAPTEDAALPAQDAGDPFWDAEPPTQDAAGFEADVGYFFEDASPPAEDAELPTDDAELPTDDAELPTDDAELPTDDAEMAP